MRPSGRALNISGEIREPGTATLRLMADIQKSAFVV